MICVKDILEKIDQEYNFSIQEKWDNSGFQFGNLNSEVTGIVLSMDITEEVVKKTIENNSNLIISHHPLFFEKITQLEKNSKYYSKLELLFKHNISVISVHTPLDLHQDGVNKGLSEFLGLDNKSILIKEFENKGYGFCGKISEQKFSDYMNKLKENSNLEYILYYGNEEDIISNVGIMGGSGAFSIKNALDNELDLLITADIKYHDAQYALENNLKLIDLGHYESEFFGLGKLKRFLENNFNFNIEIIDLNVFKRKII